MSARVHERNKVKMKRILLGNKEQVGVVQHIVLFILTIGLCYVFVSPLLTMLSMGLKDGKDLNNPLVNWFPTKLYLGNFERAWVVMGGWGTVTSSGLMFLLIAAVQTFSSAVIAYGFAKTEFPGRKILLALMIATFIIPDQVTFMHRYLLFREDGMLRTYVPLL